LWGLSVGATVGLFLGCALALAVCVWGVLVGKKRWARRGGFGVGVVVKAEPSDEDAARPSARGSGRGRNRPSNRSNRPSGAGSSVERNSRSSDLRPSDRSNRSGRSPPRTQAHERARQEGGQFVEEGLGAPLLAAEAVSDVGRDNHASNDGDESGDSGAQVSDGRGNDVETADF
jgi:hypothetical protein